MSKQRSVWQVVGAFGAIALGAFLLSMWLSGGYRWRAVGPGLAVSVLYTVCIGGLCSWVARLCWPYAEWLAWGPRWAVRIGSLLASVGAGCLFAFTILWWSGLVGGRSFWLVFREHLIFGLFITSTFGVAMMIYEYWREKYEISELERERALKLATEARLASLESRIHPHFLFNTLNSISALIHSDPAEADAQLQRLCTLLRFSLDAPETRLVPLERELKIVGDYLEIERVRFAGRLRYRIDAPPEAMRVGVPPLSVQTLAENSVKHVIAPARQGGEIVVTVALVEGRLLVRVADGGPGVAASALLPGHGLDILHGRLQALFATNASLRFDPTCVTMELPA